MVERLFPFDDDYHTVFGPAQQKKMAGQYVRSMELGTERATAS